MILKSTERYPMNQDLYPGQVSAKYRRGAHGFRNGREREVFPKKSPLFAIIADISA